MRGRYLIVYYNTPGDLALNVLFDVRGNERGNVVLKAGRLFFARTREILCVRGKED